MKILAIECTAAPLSIAVKNHEPVSLRFSSEWRKTAEQILPLISETLNDAGVLAADLDAVALSAGPGSFTALRIGMSCVKGLCFGLNVPLIMIPTLQAIAEAALSKTQAPIILPVVHSKADEFYSAVAVRTEWETSANSEFSLQNDYGILDELMQSVAQKESSAEIAIVGRNLSRFTENMQPSEQFSFLEADFFNAAALLPIAERLFHAKAFAPINDAVPLYLKEFEAKVSKKTPFV
ncbi:peptidase M22 glycoprotease [Chloroherpeton thalassium ATCC 35110]|uniref:Peptidase M22 glycoprotease n=1 Tax=Chloroherpeton thalassium (strain ATCC 35110 / GB-78) TaxID=517418 RepID=B3QSE5_CHLT3|nr:tRNA (adenosine(37)-N6)-threonylcarbamoyltransferase complex dimerization subunit type 1 TsaB [Chloroherpeton thalassium]ACF12536.1 peptidase M22 glycoprotease [Chloroherpeton thalassium ATCC 35110]